MNCIIIDDEPLARSIVKEYLQDYPSITIDAECKDGFEGIKAIQQFQPALIFLDIQMPKINGFEMLELVEHPPQIIFTTAFDEYAIRAFENNVVDYLLKPFSKERFDKAIQKVMNQKTANPAINDVVNMAAHSPQQVERVVVKNAGKIRIIPVAQIHYLEAADDYVKIHTDENYFIKKKTMQHFEDILNPQQFVRIHRSYIVNIQCITRIENYEKENFIAVLNSGQKLPVSKTGYARLKEVLNI
jgi:two-component system LytT family response regulator